MYLHNTRILNKINRDTTNIVMEQIDDEIFFLGDRSVVNIIKFIKDDVISMPPSHDINHIMRVYRNAEIITYNEYIDEEDYCDLLYVVKASALLHDYLDSKYVKDEVTRSSKIKKLENLFELEKTPEHLVKKILFVVDNVSWSKNKKVPIEDQMKYSRELKVCMDADKMDALGIIGLMRCFLYSTEIGNELYNPDNRMDSKTAFGHLYEKIIKLPDYFLTEFMKKRSNAIRESTKKYIEQFESEWTSSYLENKSL